MVFATAWKTAGILSIHSGIFSYDFIEYINFKTSDLIK